MIIDSNDHDGPDTGGDGGSDDNDTRRLHEASGDEQTTVITSYRCE